MSAVSFWVLGCGGLVGKTLVGLRGSTRGVHMLCVHRSGSPAAGQHVCPNPAHRVAPGLVSVPHGQPSHTAATTAGGVPAGEGCSEGVCHQDQHPG